MLDIIRKTHINHQSVMVNELTIKLPPFLIKEFGYIDLPSNLSPVVQLVAAWGMNVLLFKSFMMQ